MRARFTKAMEKMWTTSVLLLKVGLILALISAWPVAVLIGLSLVLVGLVCDNKDGDKDE